MVQACNNRFQVASQSLGVGSFKHVSGFIVSACENDVNEGADSLNARGLCNKFINHAGTLRECVDSATDQRVNDSTTQLEGAFI